MAIIRSIPRRGRMPSYRGRVMVDLVKGVIRVRRWPKKRGTPKSELQRWWISWFEQANFLTKYVDAISAARAIELTEKTGRYPRDILLAAMRGRLYHITDETGWTWYSMAAIGDISETLDVLAQTVGDVLVRATDRWRAPPPGTIGDVLTYKGPADPAEWQAPVGGGGFVGGALVKRLTNQSIPNNSQTVINYDGETYDTANIHDLVTNPNRLTVPVGTTWARLSVFIEFASNTSGYRQLLIRKNGVAFDGRAGVRVPAHNASTQYLSCVSAVVPVVAGDWFDSTFYQNSGSSRNIGTAVWKLWFAMELL